MVLPRAELQRGMSLVEVMIAMVLGLIVVGAAFAVFLSNQQSYTANEGLNRIQEGARVGLELIARDIRAAGGSACSNASELTGAGSDAQAFRDTPVAGDAVSLNVTSAEDSAYRIASASATSLTLEAGQVDGDDATNAFAVGDTLLLCNARKSFIVDATAVSGLVITHDALPEGYDIGADEFAGLATVAVARFRNARWFVADNSLWVSREGGSSERVVDGVNSIAFQYRSVGGVYAATPAAGNIDAVHVQLTLAGAPVDGQAVSRTASSAVNVRARTL
ncbi:prepilin-type N-terminal cleavage/methylation domain-containing protein [Luteimonas sp. 3794]|uniref:PilW family protein n=1 Tax=Luteimonas sp. 3794 TaxID=2817730 RepID=UPI0028592114|nr:prepilin-type N-terminal cleavage/methylation domain-containing protein [Luteimonas sp. 3794]MDR6992784.1 type IV pilus assembly protein PilW [Luteimonas sp. 3794]